MDVADPRQSHRVTMVVLAVFAVGSVICALAPSMGMLIAGRTLQGVAGGVFPLSFGIVRDELPPASMASGVGLIISAITSSSPTCARTRAASPRG